MSTPEPKPGKLSEILESGRAPGFVVRGGTSRGITVNVHPHFSGPHDPAKRKQVMASDWEKARKEAKAAGRSKTTGLRQIGSAPIEVHKALSDRYGDEFKGKGQAKILKEYGYLWDS
jgi:hypothetical protein